MKAMTLTPYVAAWAVLGIATLGVALYRKFVSMKEDDLIHVEEWRKKQVLEQVAVAHKLDVIDRVGETLTVLTVIGGILLAGIYLYYGWLQSQRPL
jgi:hypothetical protein